MQHRPVVVVVDVVVSVAGVVVVFVDVVVLVVDVVVTVVGAVDVVVGTLSNKQTNKWSNMLTRDRIPGGASRGIFHSGAFLPWSTEIKYLDVRIVGFPRTNPGDFLRCC